MRFAVVSRGDDDSDSLSNEMKSHLKKRGLVEDVSVPEIVITVGGDGTLLHAFHQYKEQLDTMAFVGLHTGHLGFYADWGSREMVFLALEIIKGDMQIVEYPLLDVTIRHTGGGGISQYLALNEVTLRSSVGTTMVADIELRGGMFEHFRGDGLCFSTPSGSTAYNKSLGGAIIHPSLACMQMTEMASINNRVYRTIGSPLVLPAHHDCVVKPLKQGGFHVTADHLHFSHDDVASVATSVSEKKIRFARFRKFPFWARVRESFILDGK